MLATFTNCITFPTPGTHHFPFVNTGRMLSWDKLAGDLAVTFPIFIPKPRQNSLSSLQLDAFSSSQLESVGNITYL